MNDQQQIEQLYFRYAEFIDQGKLEEVASLLDESTVFGPKNIQLAKGKDEILAMYESMVRIYPGSGTPRTHHVITNIIVEMLDQETAQTRASYTVLQEFNSGEIKTIICGQYRNSFKRRNNKWSFFEHHMIPKLMGDMSQHLKIDVVA